MVNAEKFVKERREPAEKWRKFPLVKIKLTSGRELLQWHVSKTNKHVSGFL